MAEGEWWEEKNSFVLSKRQINCEQREQTKNTSTIPLRNNMTLRQKKADATTGGVCVDRQWHSAFVIQYTKQTNAMSDGNHNEMWPLWIWGEDVRGWTPSFLLLFFLLLLRSGVASDWKNCTSSCFSMSSSNICTAKNGGSGSQRSSFPLQNFARLMMCMYIYFYIYTYTVQENLVWFLVISLYFSLYTTVTKSHWLYFCIYRTELFF